MFLDRHLDMFTDNLNLKVDDNTEITLKIGGEDYGYEIYYAESRIQINILGKKATGISGLQIASFLFPSSIGFFCRWQPITGVNLNNSGIGYLSTTRANFFIRSSWLIVGAWFYRFFYIRRTPSYNVKPKSIDF